jgi:hypothetical protein
MIASRGFANIGQNHRRHSMAFVNKFQIRDHGLIGQLVSDIVGFKRAATGQSNAKGCRTRLLAPARVHIRRVRECAA